MSKSFKAILLDTMDAMLNWERREDEKQTPIKRNEVKESRHEPVSSADLLSQTDLTQTTEYVKKYVSHLGLGMFVTRISRHINSPYNVKLAGINFFHSRVLSEWRARNPSKTPTLLKVYSQQDDCFIAVYLAPGTVLNRSMFRQVGRQLNDYGLYAGELFVLIGDNRYYPLSSYRSFRRCLQLAGGDIDYSADGITGEEDETSQATY